ncbi:uncharacterized protein MELLADRAFT_96020 [Melampsora larici-populina 98AG31]|uniref:Uncharacterized protein n=1 Tax=Melampsora larici-populina (strain 98AG31 / pathotype 3-4-7) TaxID=747676 RepID=F4SAL9_MELLP|nr:uncharacterized protein MELLADRAFT_96020 [Melampsora larici-populina 98AG31]EGF98289.1 hypothetical protein MELLADRAFT_96020 [Melampsora larici-populina 98AG31]
MVDFVAPAVLKGGIKGLKRNCQLFTCKYEYDWETAQIHYLVDVTMIKSSRNSENMGKRYPDVLDENENTYQKRNH